ncbi:cytochrome b/b6 domain-containing protein [Pantoea sp. At-9b]|uniref:cytochrome b/b6 domain-containing protein n=1 Tax=Pantoea sp. (strain At-9b) TaxID=592316 RepID=UPI0001B401AA|nr:cytochrome b/b6 domain-containing protein [Pantoea sp. At-9b]ADU71703.1 conserved hypothetical protein [Pantoea sp. At-9b]
MKVNLWRSLPHEDAPFFRLLHIIVAVLILAQIINSNFTEREALDEHSLVTVITWLHIVSGLGLIVLGVVMLAWMFSQRGFRWYFAWLRADFRAIRQDLLTLVKGRLPEAQSGGIAATIQGLGVVSLLAVAITGGLWFAVYNSQGASSTLAHSLLHWHKFLTTFIEIYFYAHGAMGISHILLESYHRYSAGK